MPSQAVRRAAALVSIFLVLLAVAPVMGQREERQIERAIREAETDYTYRTRVDPSLSVTERSMIDAGGYINFTSIWLTDSLGDYRRLYQPEVTIYARAVIDGAHSFFVRSRFQYRDYSEGDSFDGRGSRWQEPFLDRYWYEFDLRRAIQASKGITPEGNINIRGGRQFVDFGGGLALSEVLYGARPTLSWGNLDLEGIAGVTPTDESIIDFDASRNKFNTETERGFFGGLLRYTTSNANQFYAYVLHMPDWNSGDEPRIPIGVPVEFDYEATYIGVGADGSIGSQLLYFAEFVYQLGESQSDPLRGPQTTEDISAWAARGQLTYLFRDPGRSSVSFETVLASGDDDRLITTDTVGGNRSGTDDNAFNSLGFAHTGLAFAPAVSNVMLFRVGGRTYPLPDVDAARGLQLGVDFTFMNKLDKDAPIEEPTSNDLFLGFETDLILNYQITSDFTLIARLGLFFPGDAIETTSATRQFIFLGATLSF